MRKHLFLLALLGAAVPAMAQTKPAAPAAAKSKLEIINQGELRLDGKITALLGAGTWQVEASSWTSPRGVTTEFDEPKNKGISVGEEAYLHPRGEEDKVPLRDVKLGSRVAIIGKNGPDGTVIAREVILLEGYGQRKTVGQVQTNPFTSMLVGQSREARDAGQLPKAMTLIDKAIATARGMGDNGGEALATQDKALLHVDMEQPAEAMTAFKRVEALGRNMSNPLLISLGLRGTSGLLMREGRMDEAIKLLNEAEPFSAQSEPEIHLGVLSSLATAYLVHGQLDEGITALNRVYPLEQAQGKDADAGETLLSIAMLQAPEKQDEARATLKAVQERIDRARDEKAKAGLIGMSALVRWRLGEKDEAKQGFTQAAQLLTGTGNAAGAKQWEMMPEALEAAGNEWQSFWMAASGFNNQRTQTEGDTKPPAQNRPADEQ